MRLKKNSVEVTCEKRKTFLLRKSRMYTCIEEEHLPEWKNEIEKKGKKVDDIVLLSI